MSYFKEIEKVIWIIEKGLKNKISPEELAQEAYCSLPHFYRVFYEIVGDTVMNYARRRKLSCAALELVSTNRAIADISMDYGYESQQTFSRAFTRMFGVSPHRYRKNGRCEGVVQKFDVVERRIDMSGVSYEDIRFVALEPMRVASFAAYDKKCGNTFEEHDRVVSVAWGGLIAWQLYEQYRCLSGTQEVKLSMKELGKWFVDNNLHIPPKTRYFGFANPWPPKMNGGFGYETWAIVGTELSGNDKVHIKDFEGGLYAVASATYGKKSNLWETWQMMHRWLEQSEYTYGRHQWLEEHLTLSGKGGFHGIDVYMAIEKK